MRVTGCGTWSCNPYSGTADYGRLDQSFPLVEPWLLPTDPIYVDGGFSGDERGTESNPFNTVAEAKAAVIRGSTIHIEAGSYAEQFTIDRAMTLRSRHGTATIGE